MATFVLEIGSEELPSRFLAGEEAYLKQGFEAKLAESGLEFQSVSVYSTPRRAVVAVRGLALVQAEKEEEISGPPARVAWKDGQPTKALEGFARTNGVDVKDTYLVTTPKGEYVAVKKRTGGRPAADVLAEICPALVAGVPFAKRMHWGAYAYTYARPMQWVLALLDGEVVPFACGPVESGRATFGHRIHGAGPFEVASAEAYFDLMERQSGVVLDGAVRRQAIVEGGNAQAEAAGGRVLWNDALLDEVVGLAEHPVPLLADFDKAYLEVPREVLITSMQTHQKSFGVEGPDGSLLPHFVTVLNVSPEDVELVKHGWERVLRARLEDARFFWKEDLKGSFDRWLDKLEHVVFIRGLGSMGDKTRRLSELCRFIAAKCDPAEAEACARAGRLSKADLVTGVVGEFDTLQGVMGGIYAERMGESAAAARAVGEQYLPAGPDSPLPQTAAGAILSIADKADTMAGCFGLGLIPTGAADPNGLRRCALGIIRIVREFGFRLDMREIFSQAQAGYGEQEWKIDPAECLDKLMDFFAGRLRNFYQNLGVDTLLVDAALGAGLRDVKGCDSRLNALRDFSAEPGFSEAVQTFKRVANIVRKQEQGHAEIPATWRKSLLKEEPEKSLAKVLEELLPRLDQQWEAQDHKGALGLLRELRPTVDAFFDGVMVACEDAELRGNRLAMLKSMADRFARLADFAALQI